MAETKTKTEITEGSPKAEISAPLSIDLGKQKNKKIKALLRGEGGLYEEVQDSVNKLQSAGKVKKDVQLVFVHVQKKRRKRNIFNSDLLFLR